MTTLTQLTISVRPSKKRSGCPKALAPTDPAGEAAASKALAAIER